MMLQRLKVGGAAVAALALLAASPGAALAGKCSSGEAKATGKKASCKAGVFSKAASKNLAPDAGKLAACDSKFSASFAKAQSAGDCNAPVTAGATETKVDNFVNDLNTEIAVGPLPSKCQAAKLKASGKKAGCKLGVIAKGLSKGLPPDPVKTTACETKFSAAFAKAETGTTCGAAANATTIENKVDAFVADIADDVNPPPTTTTSTTTSTTATTSTTSSTTTSTTTTSTTHSTTTSTTTSTTNTTTTTTLCCGFAGAGPSRLSFTTGIGAGNCGTIQSSAGVVTKNLQCGGLFTGGGSNTVPLPYAVPDQGTSLTGVSSCPGGNSLVLTNLTSGQTGSLRNCTSVGCFFGPPLPIPNTVSTPTSVCVVNTVATNASGTLNCTSGASNLNLPLTSNLFLDGDLLPNRPGIQVCPVCLAGACVGDAGHDGINCAVNADCGAGTCALANTCHGGPNDGMACSPSDSAVNAGFPTTHDCPPPGLNNIGGLPIAFNLTTGPQSRTAALISGQNQVFCGFCRDINAAGTGCFRGDPDPGCPHNATCTAALTPWNCCTGLGTGTCDPQTPTSCSSAATCANLAGTNGTWPDCQQRNTGAFGPAGGGAHTINETGSPAGNMTDGLGHASTLVSIFCIQPTFNATVDAAGDLPGPGAVSLPGTAQLLP